MSLSIPKQASAFRKGGFIVLKGRPCKIVGMSTHKTGKHGHAKVTFTGIDIFTGNKIEEAISSTHNLEEPYVNRNEYALLSINDDGFISLISDAGETKEDLKLPANELGEKIKAAIDEGKELLAVVTSSMGEEQITDFKEDK
ncbi:eukaryotic translation initiation factor 5a [Anaeramoeba ignava]|uniref:Eukaryotic translation initiation factor 5A n=1 Tax=Anaeramoeba ignava TaxID=1746090 RepID=A0A9Q0L697_ANAIG|nr:eukaryotic translation initiation factor 5a [Anaeramoeba ignava]|eukprot:Anaeramoba_ignava/a607743_399.p1 GENE.a607743_399~~a607743_399.p1  ORF type:complete len:142 (-),score=55.45 a607743_399:221-646(-)